MILLNASSFCHPSAWFRLQERKPYLRMAPNFFLWNRFQISLRRQRDGAFERIAKKSSMGRMNLIPPCPDDIVDKVGTRGLNAKLCTLHSLYLLHHTLSPSIHFLIFSERASNNVRKLRELLQSIDFDYLKFWELYAWIETLNGQGRIVFAFHRHS